MHFIILDLEWNNAYSKKHKSFVNEIIEIGAVKLDSNLKTVDSFSLFIKAQLRKKLHSRVKELTNITNEDINTGVPFSKAMSIFRKWSNKEDSIVLTWGDTDIRVLIENFHYFNGINVIPFLNKYINLQKYTQTFLELSNSEQVGLQAAAEMLGIDIDGYSLHRALDDSYLSADIFRKVYNEEAIKPYICVCNENFYRRLLFKARAITDINSPLIDKKEMRCVCDKCGSKTERITDWRIIGHSFRAIFYCKRCKRKLKFTIKFKEFYDRVDVRSVVRPFVEKQETKESDKKEAEGLKNKSFDDKRA
ncbi:MAG TPA: 3'-5' exonuclease [Oscillospiraceae bacterium]|nr:3'-5' exonuclease [Oscillospiraceae bacterium]